MAGTFPGIVGTQQHDLNGRPLPGARLSIFQANTTALVNVFSDYALTIPAKNPVVADRGGRLPIVYVADGMYRLRLADVSGVLSNGGFDYLQVPSIGQQIPQPSNIVDPNAVFATGGMMFRPDIGIPLGWVRMNALTIGSSNSGASERANDDCEDLFLYAYTHFSDAICPVVGGRGVSGPADFAANKQLTVLDMRGRTPFGVDSMGNGSANRLTSVSTSSPGIGGSSGGNEKYALTEAQMPAHNHGGVTGTESATHTHGFPDTSTHTVVTSVSGATVVYASPAVISQTQSESATHTHSIASDGTGAAHPSMPPFVLGNWLWKL